MAGTSPERCAAPEKIAGYREFRRNIIKHHLSCGLDGLILSEVIQVLQGSSTVVLVWASVVLLEVAHEEDPKILKHEGSHAISIVVVVVNMIRLVQRAFIFVRIIKQVVLCLRDVNRATVRLIVGVIGAILRK